MKVVVALDVKAIEVKHGRHAANPVVGLEQHRVMAVARQLIGNCQAHGPAPRTAIVLFGMEGSKVKCYTRLFNE